MGVTWGFYQYTKLGYLHKHKLGNIDISVNKKFQQPNVSSSEDWTWDLWFQVWHYPFWENLDLLVRLWSGAWTENRTEDRTIPYTRLAQKVECPTWKHRSQAQSSLQVTFCCWNFLFSHSKAYVTNTSIFKTWIRICVNNYIYCQK